MPAPFPIPNEGELVSRNTTGFPLFFHVRKQRVITSDPFAFIEHLVNKQFKGKESKRNINLACLEQAKYFFDAARNPQLKARPLLYYYAFLNLEKIFLMISGIDIPRAVKHGIADPRINEKRRFRLESQRVRIMNMAHNHVQLFPEFLGVLGKTTSTGFDINIIDILGQIPSIHRAYCQVTQKKPHFIPIHEIEIRRRSGRIWARIILKNLDDEELEILRTYKRQSVFQNELRQVASPNKDEQWYETEDINGARAAADNAMRILSKKLQRTQITNILTSDGNRYYFCSCPTRAFLPPPAASFLALFYFGSVTRYRPDDFEKTRSGKYGWICEEFFATEPNQLLYKLSSILAKVDVVKPYAIVD